ncbi:hypothetical protein [Desulfovibrio ferrophilus]|uniref:Uncharacterized protein n=1 Tax=Desulfovibrio ferrophilus TaxID=241368 RepID=A0A2Z6B3P0_9BACT|nr:hypothetical protein [Desulfovibrio ferrophilus]BBD10075.1 hypothetical protein DFE_3349 [Desulfovibrio ferrophilus]
MSDTITNSLSIISDATSAPSVPRIQGAGKAYQSVAQSTAIAVQDAADYLRNIGTISSTAQGVAMAQLLATGDEKYVTALTEAQKMAGQAASVFRDIGSNAADVLKGFPSM